MDTHEGNEKDRGKEALITLGERIRELRLAKGMTQEELAKGIVSVSMISQIETGVGLPGRMTVVHLAKKLGTTVDDLYQGLTFRKQQMSAFKHALSQMAVGYYLPATVILEDLSGEELLHYEISPHELKLNLAVCYRETKRYDDAVFLFGDLLFQLPRDTGRKDHMLILVNAGLEMAETYSRMGRYFEALHAVMNTKDQYLQHQHRDPYLEGKILLQLADLYKRLHRLEEAQAVYQQALKVYEPLTDDLKQIGPIYQRLADVYWQQQNHYMAIEYSNKAIISLQAAGMIVDYREAKRVLIKQQVNAVNWQDSVSVLLNLAAIHAPNQVLTQAEIYLDVAEISLRYEDVEESMKYCLMSLSLLSKRYEESLVAGRVNYILGGVFQRKAEPQRAIQSMEKAVSLFKSHESICEYDLAVRQLSTLLRQVGERDKAFELYEEAHSFIIERLNHRGVAL